MSVELGGVWLVVERAHRCERVKGVAEADPLARGCNDTIDEFDSYGRVNEEALTGSAALPGAQISGLERRLGGEIQVGVLQDHHRTVAAELEDLGLAGRALGHAPAGGNRAHEA